MVIRRNGLNPLGQLRTEMDRLVSDFFSPLGTVQAPRVAAAPRSFPLLNVWEDGDNLFAEAELPGVKSDAIDISVVANELTIRGRRGNAQTEGVAYHRQERSAGEFNRVVRLPFEIDADKVDASLKEGVLLIRLPKADSAKPKKIKVNPPK